MKNCLIGALISCAMILDGCGDARLEPSKRPANVPENAVWAGGPDGGAYVLCSVDEPLNVNRCTIWNDYTGDSRSGVFRLAEDNRAATKPELVYKSAMMPGDHEGTIYLKDGKLLKEISDPH
jgi:hypothetical protein